MRRGLAGR
jgi:hypothetical protein